MKLVKKFRHGDYISTVGLKRSQTTHQVDLPILEVINLSLRYDTEPILENVSFRLNRAERVAVVGPNGAGKSTLFKAIAGIIAFSEGEVRIAGHQPGKHICIAYLPQRSQVDWNFPVSVTDVVMMGRIGKLGLLRSPAHRDWNFVRACLAIVDMSALANRQIGELSGGQQQRMFIARALAQEAELVLMDEPLNGLDLPAQQSIFNILDELKRQGVTVMIATHDLEQAGEYFDQVMLLNHRMLGFGAPQDVFTKDLLLEAYSGHLRFIQGDKGLIALGDTCCDDREGAV